METPSITDRQTARAGQLVTLRALQGGKDAKVQNDSPLDVLEYGKPVRQHVREFAAVFAIIFLLIAGFQAWRHARIDLALAWGAVAFSLLLCGYAAPQVLRPVWKGWMAFAHVLGTVMTTLILFIAWVLMLLPMALLLKLIGKRVMEMGFRSSAVASYWENKKKESTDFKLLERQF